MKASQPLFSYVSWSVLLVIIFLWSVHMGGYFYPSIIRNYFILSSDILFDLSSYYRFISYSFLHIDTGHLFFNTVWLFVFGSLMTRYYGKWSFLSILGAGILLGGIVMYALHLEQSVHIMGVSAGVWALIGACMRFVFKIEYDFYQKPLLIPLRDTRFLVILFLFSFVDIANAFLQDIMYGNHIAWQAHMAGFLMGILMMSHPWINHNALYRKTY